MSLETDQGKAHAESTPPGHSQAAARLLASSQNPTERPPFPLLTTDAIQLILDENSDLICAIAEAQALGRVEHCAALSSRLHTNLEYLATVADHQPANTPGPAGVAAADTIAATERATAAWERQQQQQQQQQRQGAGDAASMAAKMAAGSAAMAEREPTDHPAPVASSSIRVTRAERGGAASSRFWTEEEHAKFLELLHDPACRNERGLYNVTMMSERIGTRDKKQVRSHLQKHLLKMQQRKREKTEAEAAEPSA